MEVENMPTLLQAITLVSLGIKTSGVFGALQLGRRIQVLTGAVRTSFSALPFAVQRENAASVLGSLAVLWP